MLAAGQPLAEEEAVERVQHQALRAAGRGGNDAHVGRAQAVLAQMAQGARAGMDLQGLHGLATVAKRAVSIAPWDMTTTPTTTQHEHSELGEMDLRVRALETVLAAKGYIDPAALDVLIDTYQTKIGPRNGARVVARAWVDPAFRDWLQRDATAAIASLGYTGRQGEHMVAVENTPQRAPHGRLHAVQLLPLAGARPAAHLVQERALPLAGGEGPARRAGRLRRHAARVHRASASGTRPPRCATSSSRSARPAPTA